MVGGFWLLIMMDMYIMKFIVIFYMMVIGLGMGFVMLILILVL